MTRTPSDILSDLERQIQRLGDSKQILFAPGTCTFQLCKGSGHPDTCDGAWENGDLAPFPDRPTVKQVAEALVTARADVAEVLQDILSLVKGQQSQLVFLDKGLKGHRHKVGEGHYSERTEL